MSINKALIFVLGLFIILGVSLYSQIETKSLVKNKPSELKKNFKLETDTVSTPTPVKPSDRALKASANVFLRLSPEEKQNYLVKFSTNNDLLEAVTNLALFLDSDVSKLYEVEGIISNTSSYEDVSTKFDYSYNNDNDSSDNYNKASPYSDNKSLKYNPFEDSWGYTGNDESLKYNAFEDEWEYASDNESTKYNAMEDRWEFAGNDESTKYNAFEDSWEYAPDDHTTKYNAMEDKWEIANPDSSLKYNAFEDSWSYE